jgi:hypothetical protein
LLLKRISEYWLRTAAVSVVCLISGYVLFMVGIGPLIMRGMRQCHGPTPDPICAVQPHTTWHAEVGGVVLIVGAVLAVLALVLVVFHLVFKWRAVEPRGAADGTAPDR